MLPLDLSAWSPTALWLLSLGVGLGFGFVLESAGFGDSRRLAAQFYGRDMAVLKVMFGAIITAAGLIVLLSALGWLDFGKLYVNPTFLPSQVLGGLIMGVGFIIGGFCPGTSLVAVATFKVDGMVFLAGVLVGIFLFGESVQGFESFYEAGNWGRYTIADWWGVDLGWALLAVTVMALAMFYAGELAEAVFGRGQAWKDLDLRPRSRWKLAGAGALLLAALLAILRGQPDLDRRWQAVAPRAQGQLLQRAVQAHPLELIELEQNAAMNVQLLDVRSEAAFNLFHLRGAQWTPLERFRRPELAKQLAGLPSNTVVFVLGQAEREATLAWQLLQAQHVPNAYILEGGYNRWWQLFPPEACLAEPVPHADPDAEQPTWRFLSAVGDRTFAAHPDCGCNSQDLSCRDGKVVPSKAVQRPLPKLPFVHKVKVTVTAAKKGGCG